VKTVLRFRCVAALTTESSQKHDFKIQGKVVVKMVLGEMNNASPSAGHLTHGAPRCSVLRRRPQAAVAAPFGCGGRQGRADCGGPGITATDAKPAERARQRDGSRWGSRQTGRACNLTRTTPTAGAKPGDTPTPLSLPWW